MHYFDLTSISFLEWLKSTGYAADNPIQRCTECTIDGNNLLFEGDFLKFSRTTIGKTYLNHDYKNPIFGKPETLIWIGEVVFGIATDIDDFYTDEMLGWCVRKVSEIEWRSSLIGQINKHRTNESYYYKNTYGDVLHQSCQLVGNVYQNPELIK